MKVPRDISGQDLIKHLKPYGYTISRQSGSHIRVSTDQQGQHHITIPNHTPLKIGTLSAVLSDVADHFNMTKDQLMQAIFT